MVKQEDSYVEVLAQLIYIIIMIPVVLIATIIGLGIFFAILMIILEIIGAI